MAAGLGGGETGVDGFEEDFGGGLGGRETFFKQLGAAFEGSPGEG